MQRRFALVISEAFTLVLLAVPVDRRPVTAAEQVMAGPAPVRAWEVSDCSVTHVEHRADGTGTQW